MAAGADRSSCSPTARPAEPVPGVTFVGDPLALERLGTTQGPVATDIRLRVVR